MARKANVVEAAAAVEESGHGSKRKRKTKKKNSLYHKGVPPLPCEKEKKKERKHDSMIENKLMYACYALGGFTCTLKNTTPHPSF